MLEVKKGKYGFNLYFTVLDEDGQPFNLTNYTVKFRVWDSSDNLILDGACTVDDAVNGKCHYTVQSGDFATAGTFTAELNLTKTGEDFSTMSTTVTVYDSP